ncbi:MAG: hypothetical protein M0Z70_12045 [Nitrospiraceae bacterium]|jgi:hypothetical protein|nr:hypothetical protein [Nitrospiraceae bacterium]
MYNPSNNPNRIANARELEYAEKTCRGHPDICTELHRLVPRGSTIYYLVMTVSSSGMSRNVRFFVVSDGKIVDISGLIREYLGYSRPRAQGLDYAVRLGGYGTDVGYDAIIHLASALYAESYALVPKRL